MVFFLCDGRQRLKTILYMRYLLRPQMRIFQHFPLPINCTALQLPLFHAGESNYSETLVFPSLWQFQDFIFSESSPCVVITAWHELIQLTTTKLITILMRKKRSIMYYIDRFTIHSRMMSAVNQVLCFGMYCVLPPGFSPVYHAYSVFVPTDSNTSITTTIKLEAHVHVEIWRGSSLSLGTRHQGGLPDLSRKYIGLQIGENTYNLPHLRGVSLFPINDLASSLKLIGHYCLNTFK